MPNPALSLFLDPEGGSLAFKKENDYATYPATPHHNDQTTFTPPTGSAITAPACVDVREFRNGMVVITPSDLAATYSVRCYSGRRTGKHGTGLADGATSPNAKLGLIDNLTLTDQSGIQERAVSFFGRDWFFVEIVGLSAGNCTVEVGVNEYETGGA